MPTGVLASYIPWILYFIIAGSSSVSIEIAAIVAFIAEIIFGYKYLAKKFLLDWCTLIYFALLSFLYFTPLRSLIDLHAYLFSNVVLAAVMWISILIRHPFTLQYAKEKVPQLHWGSPMFLKINYYISGVWAIALTLMAVVIYCQYYLMLISSTVSIAVQIISLVVALQFTKLFPDWYQGFLFRKFSKNRQDLSKNYYLQGNYAPVRVELSQADLEVVGTIPTELNGVYMRNGPNPAVDPISYTYPIDGDGMIHAVYLKNGTASYRNKYVETKGYLAEKRSGHALYGGIARPIPVDPKLVGKDGDQGPVKNGAFIHVLFHANHIMAMSESDPAYEITHELKTLGEWLPANAVAPFAVNAHTRLDPHTQDLYVFCYDLQPPFLQYSVINKFGQLIKTKIIEKADASMIHDFVLTQHYVIFFDGPAIFDMKQLATGGKVLQWRPERKMQIIIVDRQTDAVTVIEEEAYFVYHFANAYEQDNQIYIDYVRHQQLFLGDVVEKTAPPQLFRAAINVINKTVTHEKLLDSPTEFPRINDRFVSQAYRYIYLPCKSGNNRAFTQLVKFDLHTKQSLVYDFTDKAEIGEPVFVLNPNAQQEDDGYVVLFAYFPESNRSEFVMFDAKAIQVGPIARVKLLSRVPHGLHGTWLSD